MNKLTLQALALSGILAVSGLPAFAADIAAPATPNASVSTDTKANIGTSVDKAKSSAVKSVDKNKSAAKKKAVKSAENTKSKVHHQTAAKPAIPSVSSSTGANASVGNTGVNAATGANVH